MAQKAKINRIVGQKIVEIRTMTEAEMEAEGWEEDMHGRPLILILECGTKIYPSCDEEGNGAGCLFGSDAKAGGFYLVADKEESCTR